MRLARPGRHAHFFASELATAREDNAARRVWRRSAASDSPPHPPRSCLYLLLHTILLAKVSEPTVLCNVSSPSRTFSLWPLVATSNASRRPPSPAHEASALALLRDPLRAKKKTNHHRITPLERKETAFTRGAPALDGARGRKQVWCPPYSNLKSFRVNVLHWRKHMGHC